MSKTREILRVRLALGRSVREMARATGVSHGVVIDPTTGEVIDAELFVAVLGASNFTFVEATRTQTIPDFIASHVRAFDFFGGVPKITVPDQLRSAVRLPCRYEPTVARAYADLGKHYGTAIVPARPRKPRDKAKVEVAVQIAQRWVLARLRNETFFSLASLNERIAELTRELNARPGRRRGARVGLEGVVGETEVLSCTSAYPGLGVTSGQPSAISAARRKYAAGST